LNFKNVKKFPTNIITWLKHAECLGRQLWHCPYDCIDKLYRYLYGFYNLLGCKTTLSYLFVVIHWFILALPGRRMSTHFRANFTLLKGQCISVTTRHSTCSFYRNKNIIIKKNVRAYIKLYNIKKYKMNLINFKRT